MMTVDFPLLLFQHDTGCGIVIHQSVRQSIVVVQPQVSLAFLLLI